MSAQPRTFRATPEAWLGHLLLPAAFYVLLAYTAVEHADVNAWIAGLGLSLVVVLLGVRSLLPMLRDSLRLDRRSIRGSLSGRSFELYWTEILAAWIVRQDRQELLCLGTRTGTVVIPLRFFDRRGLWEYVQGSVSLSALEEDALHRLPDYREWAAARKTALEAAAQPDGQPQAIADHWITQVIAWTGISFFLFGALDAYERGDLFATLTLLALTVYCLMVLLSWGVSEIGPAGVERRTLFGSWHIAWEEVQRVEIGPADLAMVLVGDERTLALPGPALWNRSGRSEALALLVAQAEKRGIPFSRTPQAMFRGSRNTRIKK